jgi:hypothetical protein
MWGAKVRRHLAFEGVFEDGLAVGFELFAGGGQGFDAFVQFGEQFLNLGNDAALLASGGYRNAKRIRIIAAQTRYSCRFLKPI